MNTVNGSDPENGTAYSEIYPPLNFVRAIENRQPHLLESCGCLSERRAIVKADENTPFKLIHVNDKPDELFNLTADPLELENQLTAEPHLTKSLHEEIERMASQVTHHRDNLDAGDEVELDDVLKQQLRGLGYIE
jgi:arylsulfatase A-like enzyme